MKIKHKYIKLKIIVSKKFQCISTKKVNLILFNYPKPQFDIISATADLIVIDRWTKQEFLSL